ncbi:oxygenase MpaB family protein [Rapidithrix thailandica]|uniref:Oxygenase MpaB family protein n=1 Tax=Rapidithrix thailandica TaxID=413964 RepID=A0AAW9SBM0_9BACT
MKRFTNSLLEKARFQADPLADQLISQVIFDDRLSQLFQLSSPYDIQNLPEEVREYFLQPTPLPDWADVRKIKLSSHFLEQHLEIILNLLGSYSLPYCFAAAKGAKALQITGQMTHNTEARLAYTAAFVLTTLHREALLSPEKGPFAIKKIRLIHALNRYQIEQSKQWSEGWGKPINQEEMSGTNLAFSLIILRGLRKLGYVIKKEESEAYLHTWAVISYLLGVSEELLPTNGKEAYHLEKLIAGNQFRPSEAGQALTASLIYNLTKATPKSINQDQIQAYIRFLVGNEVANILGIPETYIFSRQVLRVSLWVQKFMLQFSTLSSSDKVHKKLLEIRAKI